MFATQIPTPLGVMWGVADTERLFGLLYAANALYLKSPLRKWLPIERGIKWVDRDQRPAVLSELVAQLEAYFQGQRQTFELPFADIGTAFQQASWRALDAIPYAHTVSYQQQAHQIQHPKAVRAVANANRLNPWSIVVPCHRVVGANGQLTGYAGGLWRKRWLLALERRALHRDTL